MLQPPSSQRPNPSASREDRTIAFEGAWNFRDAGGLPTSGGRLLKRGMVFRSDALHRLTPADLRKLGSLGLRTVCDLRMPNERKGQLDKLPSPSGPRPVHLPLCPVPGLDPTRLQRLWGFLSGKFKADDLGTIVAESYLHIARDQATQLARVLALLADADNLPLLVHCQGGKDRTGLVVAILHRLLGVSHEQMLSDYLLTNRSIEPQKRRLMRLLRWFTLFRLSPTQLQPLLEARAQHLEAAIALMEQSHGSVERYMVEAGGMPTNAVGSLRDTLLE